MNVFTSLCFVAVLVVAVWAEESSHTADGYGNPGHESGYGNPDHGSGYGNPDHGSGYGNPDHGSSYGNPARGSGYGNPDHGSSYGNPARGSSYGNPARGSGYGGSGYGGPGPRAGYGGYYGGLFGHRMASTMFGNEPLNTLDKLFERVKDVQDQVKSRSEQVEALSALLSIQEKKLKELVQVIFVELKETDMRQIEATDKLDSHLVELAQDSATLNSQVNNLKVLNENNTELQLEAEKLWAAERAVDVKQDGQINTLYTTARLLKTELLQVKDNEFEVFFDAVERDTTLLGSLKEKENRRMCEVGQVTLDADDRRVEYQYQNWFDTVPQIIYGMAGLNFNLDTREDPAHYGYGYPPQEPEAIGARVNAYSTKTGINLEVFDLSFGDTSMVSVDVAFQACTIGPGTDPVDH